MNAVAIEAIPTDSPCATDPTQTRRVERLVGHNADERLAGFRRLDIEVQVESGLEEPQDQHRGLLSGHAGQFDTDTRTRPETSRMHHAAVDRPSLASGMPDELTSTGRSSTRCGLSDDASNRIVFEYSLGRHVVDEQPRVACR